MKKRNVFFTILLVTFLIGIIFVIIGACLGGRLFSFQMHTPEAFTDDGGNYQTGSTILDSDTAASIESIDFQCQTNDMQIVAGDHFEINGSGQYQHYVEDGVWHVATPKWIATISFLSRHIEVPVFWNSLSHWTHGADAESHAENTIMIPENIHLKKATLKTSAGNLYVQAPLLADTITLKTGAGSSEFDKISADTLNLKLGAGQSIVHGLTVNNVCNVQSGAGEVIIGDRSNTEIHGLSANCSMGDLKINGKLLDTCSINCSAGSVDLFLEGLRSNYTFVTHASLGSINIEQDDLNSYSDNSRRDNDDDRNDNGHDDDDRNDDGHNDNDNDNDRSDNGHDDNDSNDRHNDNDSYDDDNRTDTYATLTLQCSMGDIDVDFNH